jgi:hypothetical protein
VHRKDLSSEAEVMRCRDTRSQFSCESDNAAIQCLQGTVIAEKGDMYNLDAWRVGSILGRDFKYPESLGERTAIELAHHISFAGRKLINEPIESEVDGS